MEDKMIRFLFVRVFKISMMIFTLFAMSHLLSAADVDLKAKNPIDLEFKYKGTMIDFMVDVYYFKTSNENDYNVQVWYRVPNANLVFKEPKDKKSENKLEANLILAINTYTEGSKLEPKSHVATITFPAADENDAKDANTFSIGSLSFLLSPGIYVTKVGITDYNSDKIGIQKAKFEIPVFDAKKLMFSSVVFADKIEDPLKKDKEDDIYYVKNIDKRIFPNFKMEYKSGSELITYYEIYNLQTDTQNSPNFETTYYFDRIDKAKKEGAPNVVFKLKKQVMKSDPAVKGNFSVQYYPLKLEKELVDKKNGQKRPGFIPGLYRMTIEVVDHNAKEDAKHSISINFKVVE
jgi:hypothetical protein